MKMQPRPRDSAGLFTLFAVLLAPLAGSGMAQLALETQARSESGAIGWIASADWAADPAPTVDLDKPEIIDWVMPNTDTTAETPGGRLAVVGPQKAGVDIILLEDFGPATFTGLNGPHQAELADTHNVFFHYSDGDLGDGASPAGGYYGNRWFADRDAAGYIVWTVDLADTPRTVWYFWNHNFRSVTTLSAVVKDISGTALTPKQSFTYETLDNPIVPEDFTSIITATAENAGDYLEISIVGNNPTFRGIAVLERQPVDYGPFNDFLETLSDGVVDTGGWLGLVYVETYPWVWPYALGRYIYSGGDAWLHIRR